jgi:hypothetical protein
MKIDTVARICMLARTIMPWIKQMKVTIRYLGDDVRPGFDPRYLQLQLSSVQNRFHKLAAVEDYVSNEVTRSLMAL